MNLYPYWEKLTRSEKRLLLACLRNFSPHKHVHLGSLPFVSRMAAVLTVYLMSRKFTLTYSWMITDLLKKLGAEATYTPNQDTVRIKLDNGTYLDIPFTSLGKIDYSTIKEIR